MSAPPFPFLPHAPTARRRARLPPVIWVGFGVFYAGGVADVPLCLFVGGPRGPGTPPSVRGWAGRRFGQLALAWRCCAAVWRRLRSSVACFTACSQLLPRNPCVRCLCPHPHALNVVLGSVLGGKRPLTRFAQRLLMGSRVGTVCTVCAAHRTAFPAFYASGILKRLLPSALCHDCVSFCTRMPPVHLQLLFNLFRVLKGLCCFGG